MNVINIVLLTGIAVVAIPLTTYLSVKLGRYAWLRATDRHTNKLHRNYKRQIDKGRRQ